MFMSKKKFNKLLSTLSELNRDIAKCTGREDEIKKELAIIKTLLTKGECKLTAYGPTINLSQRENP